MKIKIEVVKVKDQCAKKYKVGDVFIFDKGNIIPINNEIDKACIYAFRIGVGIDRFFAGEKPFFYSCVDAGYGQGCANVIFKISEDESL